MARVSRAWRTAFVVSLAVVVLAGLVSVGWLWRHPGIFPAQGGYGIDMERASGTTLIGLGPIDLDGVSPRTITLHAVEASVVDDSGDAAVRFLKCHPRSTEQSSLGTGNLRQAAELCDLTEVTDGTRLVLADEGQDFLLLQVRLARAGTLEVEGYEVTYSSGWRTGTQLTGPDIKVTRP